MCIYIYVDVILNNIVLYYMYLLCIIIMYVYIYIKCMGLSQNGRSHGISQ
jgi:hypothetical protein